jgi:hypothetical protein
MALRFSGKAHADVIMSTQRDLGSIVQRMDSLARGLVGVNRSLQNLEVEVTTPVDFASWHESEFRALLIRAAYECDAAWRKALEAEK